MITLLASLTGFITSIIPELLKLFKDAKDKQHQLNILDKQIKYGKRGEAKLLENIKLTNDIPEITALYSTYKSGIFWVDMLNSSVRPLLAYSFFIMYAAAKFIQYKTISKSSDIMDYLSIIWNVDDQAIFASIISFYFGQRTFSKLWKHKI